MYLKELQLNGFKSFAKKTSITFDTPITAIVGPNGSGKSNVAEALRWVLGEQSMKSLRGKRGEDLIFSGSRSLPRQNRAAVTLAFDNRNKIFDIDFDEVSITREVFRDGANDYYINNSPVRLRDVVELLSAVSLGASSHHIISQNEADRILSASPKERKNMIEDALGLRVYHWKISEAERKLARTDANMREAQSARREISGHLRFLAKEVEKIEKAEEWRQELFRLYQVFIASEVRDMKRERQRIEDDLREPESARQALEEKLIKLEEERRAAGTGSESKAISDLDRRIEELRNRRDELSRSVGRLEGMLEYERKRPEQGQATDDERTFAADDVEAFIWEIEEFLAEAESCDELDEVYSVLQKIRETMERFRERGGETAFAGGDPDEGRDADMRSLAEEKEKLEGEMERIGKELEALASRREEESQKIEAMTEEVRERERAYFEVRERIAELHHRIEALQSRRSRISHRAEDLSREIEEARAFVGAENAEELARHKRASEEGGAGGQAVGTDVRRSIDKLKIRLEESGPASESVLSEHKEVEERDAFLAREIEDLAEGKRKLEDLIHELRRELEAEFKKGIQKVNKEFARFFELMFGGGAASLHLVRIERYRRGGEEETAVEESLEEEEGIDIRVNLPRKKIRGLEMLSGGERALTSIALLFAMTQVKPPPFLVLDETDAALDEANSRKYGDMIENLAKETQLVLITHNRETMSRAGVLYGITMGSDGVSKLLSVRFEEAVKIAK